MLRLLIGAAALTLLTTGCSGGGQSATVAKSPEPSTSPTTTLKPSPTEEASSDTPAAPNVGASALRVGETRKGTGFKTTLLAIRYPYPPGQYREPQPGNAFVGLKIRECMKSDAEPSGGDYSTYNGDWYAVSPSGNQVTGSTSWTDWPKPKFPEAVTLNPGDCLRGWLTVEVPQHMKIKKIVWRPGGETVAEWLP